MQEVDEKNVPNGREVSVEIRDFSFRYPGTERWALQDINLKLYAGELALLMGPTGCGKSTLLMCLRGLIPRVINGELKGSILIGAKDISGFNLHQLANEVFLIMQDPNDQVCTLVVEDDVAFALENLQVPSQTARGRVDDALKETEMAALRTKEVYNLSGGQKQRVAIAGGIALRPKVLVVDNPTANLDPIGTREVMSTMLRLSSNYDMTMLVVEQKVDDLIDKADRILIMDHSGRLVYDGLPRTITERYGQELEKTLGLRIAQCPRIGMSLREKGIPIESLPLNAEEIVSMVSDLKTKQLIRVKPGETWHAEEQRGFSATDQVVAKGVYFDYPDGTKVLKDVNFSVSKGDFLALIGANGGGKTTLCLNLLGILKPTKGAILISGLDTKTASLSKLTGKIGYSFQEPERQLVADTVYEEIAFGLRVRGYSNEEIDSRVREMLETFHLVNVKDEHPFRISMGEKRLLSVASILVSKPDVFILDEPITGQDLRSLSRLMNVLKRFNDEGTTIIIVTHDMNVATEYAKTVLMLHNGQVDYYGPVRKFFGEHEPPRESGITFPPVCKASRQLRELGISPYTITPDEFCDQIERSATET